MALELPTEEFLADFLFLLLELVLELSLAFMVCFEEFRLIFFLDRTLFCFGVEADLGFLVIVTVGCSGCTICWDSLNIRVWSTLCGTSLRVLVSWFE